MTSGLRVLLVDGTDELARQLEPELAACSDVAIHVEAVAGGDALTRALDAGGWDAVAVSTGGDSSLDDVMRAVRARNPDLPIVIGSLAGLRRSLRRMTVAIEARRNALQRAKRELTVREEQLRHAQKMEIIGNFAGGIAHDFNNIMTGIGGSAALLLQDWPVGQTGREDIEEIVRSTEQAQALARQLLGFARRDSHRAGRIDLADAIHDLEPMLRRSAGTRATVEIDVAHGLALVRADPNQLQQVLLNLVLNARDASPDGGVIHVEAREESLMEEVAAVDGPVPPGAWVRLSVSDTGVGMDEAARRRIFEPFFTTKGPGHGTGLGLAVVHDILRRADAHVRVVSAPGRGTTFDLYFPPAPASAGDAPVADDDGRTILLVEDDPSLRALVVRMLRGGGYTVLAAGDAEQALDILREHEGPLHLLLTDVVLPARNGRELARDAALLRPGLPTLYMSGYSDDVIERAGLEMANPLFLDKPFGPDALLARVRQALESASTATRA